MPDGARRRNSARATARRAVQPPSLECAPRHTSAAEAAPPPPLAPGDDRADHVAGPFLAQRLGSPAKREVALPAGPSIFGDMPTRFRFPAAALAAAIGLPATGQAQSTVQSTVLDDSIPPGANYDKAQFRLWVPK